MKSGRNGVLSPLVAWVLALPFAAGATYTDGTNNTDGGNGYIGFRLFCSVKEAVK